MRYNVPMKTLSLQSQALVPMLISEKQCRTCYDVLSVVGGVMLLSGLAQIAIPLPFTPVPITGQTFGVALTALLWGRTRGMAVMASYLCLGGLGAPVFALGKSGLLPGPTTGFLVGMFVAAAWMGFLADRGWTKKLWQTWLAATSGSAIVFAFGVAGLSFFLPKAQLLMAGVVPFLPGDLLKTFVVSLLVSGSVRKFNSAA